MPLVKIKKKITNLCKAVAQRCIFFLFWGDTNIEQKKNCTVQDRTDAKNSPIIQSQVYKQHGEVMAVAMITLKESWKKCVCVCPIDGHYKAHTSYFPHCLLQYTQRLHLLAGRKLIWFNSKRKPATDEKTISREKAKLCKIQQRLQIWGEKIVWWMKIFFKKSRQRETVWTMTDMKNS